MFKKILTIGLAACTLLTACSKKKTDENTKTLVVGVCADYAPYEFYKDGEIVGFDIDLINEIGKRLGKELIIGDMTFDAIVASLTSDRIDVGISSLQSSPERRKSIDFTRDYIKSNRVMVYPETSNLEGIDDLADATIGVQSGSTHETYANKVLSKEVRVTIKSIGKITDLVQDMNGGRLSGIIMGTPEAEALIKTNDKLKTMPLPGDESGAAIGLPKGSVFTAKIDKVLGEMESDGSIAKLKEKWSIK